MLLRAVYVLVCIGILAGAWVWAHDTPQQLVSPDLTPRSAGPLMGQPGPSPISAMPTRGTLPTPLSTAAPTEEVVEAIPTAATATPWPIAAAITPDPTGHTLVLQDRNFAGGSPPPDGLYRDRTARVAMGGTDPISAEGIITAPFNLNLAVDGPIREAALTLVGLSSPLSPAPQLRISLNDTLLYAGASPFPLDDEAGQARPANWGGASWKVPETVFQQGGNTLVITNLADTTARFIAVDYIVLVWKR